MSKENFFFMMGVGILFIFIGPFAWWINLLLTIGWFLAPILIPITFFLLVVFGGSKEIEKDKTL